MTAYLPGSAPGVSSLVSAGADNPAGKRLSLAFLSPGDPLNVLTWSGTPLHMLTALQNEFDVKLVVRRPWARWFDLARRVVRRGTGGKIDLYWSPTVSALGAAGAIKQVSESGCDVIFAVAATPICAQLAKLGPTVFVSDATLGSMANYYPRHRKMAGWMKRAAMGLESQAIQKATAALFPSKWASQSATRDHGGAPERVVQIPWGANLLAEEAVPPEQRSEKSWRLLFVGVDWDRKGGDIVLETVAEMRRRGYPVHIDIVGSGPPQSVEIDGVTFHGFLDKQNPVDNERIMELFASAHVFFLPTKFEALGIVFAEAASFALPTVSYKTGGVPSIVSDEVTGVLLDEGSSPTAFAETLIALLSDRRRYVRMSYAALAASREQLNWPAWAAAVRRMVEEKLGVKPTAAEAAARRRALAECGTPLRWRAPEQDDHDGFPRERRRDRPDDRQSA